MRKVLLATTALVAMGGVSAASADISISGSASYNYVTNSGSGTTPSAAEDRDMSTTVDTDITMSAAFDNGMSATGIMSLHEGGVDTGTGWTLSGDFGTLGFGQSANDGFGAVNTGLTADEGDDLLATYLPTHTDSIPHSDVSITLPAVSGFTLGLGIADGATSAADSSQWGVTYAMDAGAMSISIGYASSSDGSNKDDSSAGVTVTSGGTKVVVATNKTTTSGVTHTANSIGASYKVSDALTVQAYSGTTERSNDSAYEVSDTGVGLTYTITPGLSLSVTNNDYSGKSTSLGAESGTKTTIALDATF